ncbi:hypothetical protein A8C75_00965 [Marinobacterium aestuarii]|uniref:Uncharacterized protein n=1 Tax=Marinobacterium aestuarii TaxID=1821621 RepID=A0A1A9ETF0_9GAMM|nr:hypothetical protein A8C75_00965 [Marinobacterium aestuarii]
MLTMAKCFVVSTKNETGQGNTPPFFIYNTIAITPFFNTKAFKKTIFKSWFNKVACVISNKRRREIMSRGTYQSIGVTCRNGFSKTITVKRIINARARLPLRRKYSHFRMTIP